MTAVVTLSMEIELAWGVHDIGEFGHLSEDGVSERTYLDRLLERCEQGDVPVSFDVVGHLCQAACDGDHDGPHPGDWFDADPGTDAASDPLYYAPEMVEAILACDTAHEVCTHTYSHVPCEEMQAATVSWELDRSQSVLESTTGSPTVSIVPPRHSRPSAESLRGADIEIMRMSRDTSDRNVLSRAKELLVGPHPVHQPAVVDGVLETYCTTYPSLTSSALPAGQRPAPTVFEGLPVRTRQYLQRRYLRRTVDRAANTDGYCHLWCHLYDLANEYQWPVVDWFLDHLAERHERGDVRVLTMEQLNDRYRNRSREVCPRAHAD